MFEEGETVVTAKEIRGCGAVIAGGVSGTILHISKTGERLFPFYFRLSSGFGIWVSEEEIEPVPDVALTPEKVRAMFAAEDYSKEIRRK